MENHSLLQDQWFQSPPGSLLLALEKQQIQRMLAQQFGDILVQIGGPSDNLFTQPSPIVHRILIGESPCPKLGLPYIQAQYDELPLKPDSIDIVVCMHVFEFTEEPEALLEQIYQSLVPNGRLLIIGFNPFSLWGLSHYFQKSKDFPWNGKFHSQVHLKTLLQKIGFTVQNKKTFCFRPPMKNAKLWQSLLVLEPIGQFFMPDLGGIYFLSVRKKIAGMTGLFERLKQKTRLDNSGCAEPSARKGL